MHNFPSILESITDLRKTEIEGLLSLAKKFKSFSSDWEGLPVPFIKTPLIATSFLEYSTRTKNSFIIAIKKIGAFSIDVDLNKSSLLKGESLRETLSTFYNQGVDLCIMRTNINNQFSSFKEFPPIKIINGGDGTNQHPTQALLDLFTMFEIGFNLREKTIAIIGDNIHSRVGHSLIDLFPLFHANVILCGPQEFLPKKVPPKVTTSTDLDHTLQKSDMLYLLRIQKERHMGKIKYPIDSYHQDYGMDLKRLKKHNKKIPIFHPGPANIGVEISQDLYSSPYVFAQKQVQNSIYMRMAIIQAILQNNDKNIGVHFDNRKLSDLP